MNQIKSITPFFNIKNIKKKVKVVVKVFIIFILQIYKINIFINFIFINLKSFLK